MTNKSSSVKCTYALAGRVEGGGGAGEQGEEVQKYFSFGDYGRCSDAANVIAVETV